MSPDAKSGPEHSPAAWPSQRQALEQLAAGSSLGMERVRAAVYSPPPLVMTVAGWEG